MKALPAKNLDSLAAVRNTFHVVLQVDEEVLLDELLALVEGGRERQ